MDDDKIPLNEMREQAGRLIFGDDWIGGLTDEEHELLRQSFFAHQVDRADGSTIVLRQVKRLSPEVARELDLAIGRAVRLQAQYVTVDTWLQDHGMLRGVERIQVDDKTMRQTFHGDRQAFLDLIQSELAKQPAALPAPEIRRGPKAEILPRVKAEMDKDLREGRLTREQLSAMPNKEGEQRYQAKRERFRQARDEVLNPDFRPAGIKVVETADSDELENKPELPTK